MDLKDLQAKGAFVKVPPIAKEITWRHKDDATGEEMVDTFIVHIRRMSVGWMERVFAKDKKGRDRSTVAATLAEAVTLGETGQQKIPYDLAFDMNLGLAETMMNAFREVNNMKRLNAEGKEDGPEETEEEAEAKN